ncbi:MAG: amidophosphoribosyltransferase, partial [bacterium]|nr:amidophosphoribosyltransferase [bacterium]MDW8163155.1 amidophosphoribosyltransferase [Candidatus Omnitrophota bacterium]
MKYENCGIFGIYSEENCIEKIFYGLFKLQHRGQKFCGIATFNKNFKLVTHDGFVRHSFTDFELKSLSAKFGIGHVSVKERQPILIESKLGCFAIAFAGNITNFENLMKDLKNEGHSFSSHTQIEVIAKIIVQGNNFVDGIKKLSQKIKGSYTILILTKNGIFATRDPFGFKPMIIGQNK